MSIQIHESRREVLADDFEKPYFQDIKERLLEKKSQGEIIYPPWSLIFNAFDKTPFDEVKVVILGQDPYHGPGQAHGLSFSVPDGVALPPSLKNIFKEMTESIKSDEESDESRWSAPNSKLPHNFPWWGKEVSGNLEYLAEQGVLLLNAILTVTAHKPASHHDIWRQQFTDAVIRTISELRQWVVFLLRGNFARQKKSLIDTNKHIVLETTHPSPFSAHKGFLGCGHFREVNQLLAMQGKKKICWLKEGGECVSL